MKHKHFIEVSNICPTITLTEITNIDQMRLFLFNKGKDADSLPPTSEALKLHISRAHYQITVWLNVTVPSPERIDPETCGWEPDPYSEQLKPKLLLLEPVPKVCIELLPFTGKICTTRSKTILHPFHRAAVDQLLVAIH